MKKENKKDTLLVNRVCSDKKKFALQDSGLSNSGDAQDDGASKTERVRRALINYRIAPYLISIKQKMVSDVVCDPAISVEQAFKLIDKMQGEICELDYVRKKIKRVLDELSFTQRDILSEIENGASCAEIAKEFSISSRTAFRLVSKLEEEICP